jgi:hypothetical protein
MNDYTAFFCEENIWRLARRQESVDHCFVLFFFNQSGTIALREQKPFGEQGVGLWDYHVVLLDRVRGLIHDFDTRLSMPSPARVYLDKTFPQQDSLHAQYRTTVRCVPAQEYLARFSSDRSHMLNENGVAHAPFPKWPVIESQWPITLQEYVSDGVIAGSDSVVVAVDRFDPDCPLGG